MAVSLAVGAAAAGFEASTATSRSVDRPAGTTTPAKTLIGLLVQIPGRADLAPVLINSDGSDPRLVGRAPGEPFATGFGIVWSADGTSIAYSCGKGAKDEKWAICAGNATTRRARRLTNAPSHELEPLAWGPAAIAAECDQDNLCFVDPKTGAVTFVTTSGPSNHDGYIFGEGVWSPDGSTLALVCSRITAHATNRICLVGKDDQLTMEPTPYTIVGVEGWSPDSKHIFWWGHLSKHDHLSYYEQNADGTDTKAVLTDTRIRGPHYSPDGRTRLIRVGAAGDLSTEPVGGGTPRVILSPGRDAIWDWAWQPH
jgi:WD40-like Beta Propeller Repeat